MNGRWTAIVLGMAIFGCGLPTANATEVLCSEDFDEQGVKPSQSILEPPLGWKLVAPNDPGKNLVGNVSVGAGQYDLTGNYLDGETATAQDAENAFQKTFPAVTAGRVVLTCRAFAPGETSAGSCISLRPGQARFSNRGGGWISTAKGWDFWVAQTHSDPYPLDTQKPGPYKILKKSLTGGHDVPIDLAITVDLDNNKAWGHARWKDDRGLVRRVKTDPFPWNGAGGDVANVSVSIDKRSGHTGIALDDLRVKGERPKRQPHPFGQPKHAVLQLNGDKEPVSLPAELQWISKPWDNENAQMPYLVYMPEKDRLLMIASCRKPCKAGLTDSDDQGRTWSPRRWMSVDKEGHPSGGVLGLTYLGGGNLMAFPGGLDPLWVSSDYGKTWKPRSPKSWPTGKHTWDPLLVVRDADGRIERLAEGCWKPTGVPWATAGDPYSQGYFCYSRDEGDAWTDPVKVPQWLGVNEITMLIAKNGDWVAACRVDYPQRYAHHGLDHYGGLGVSISKDQGKTWSDMKMLHEWGRHHPSMVLLPDGRILMSYVVRLGYPNTEEGFPQFGVEAVLSDDNGQTWDLDHRYILAKWVGNLKGEDFWFCSVQSSSTVLLPDGTLVTAFGTGFTNAPDSEWRNTNAPCWCKMDVALVRWRLDGQPLD